MRRVLPVFLMLCLYAGGVSAADMEVTPFRMINGSPMVQIFGLPAQTSATVAPAGRTRLSLTQDVASNYTYSNTGREQILLDGESYRWSLSARYGIGDRFEVGLEIPYILTGGGFLDGFIEGWHSTFGLPQGGRDTAPRDRLQYRYTRDGVKKLDMRNSGSGVGDISLLAAVRLYDSHDSAVHDSLALRTTVKLPTGDSAALRGSGSTDFTVSLCGSMNSFTEWGTLALYGSIGGMAMTRGKVLADQQKQLAAFGTAGIGWGVTEWLSFKFQTNLNTPMYRSSSLPELSRNAVMLILGGALKLPGGYVLDIGMSEDVIVATSPDVVFHLGVSRQF